MDTEAGGDVIAFRRSPTAQESLAAIRSRYDRGGYMLLSIFGMTHDGVEERLTIHAPAYYTVSPASVLFRRVGAPLARLAAMRARCDGGEYCVYAVVATRSDGRMDRVTVFREATSRWVANQ